MGAKYTACDYESAAGGCGYDCLMEPVRRMLGAPRGPILDVGCGNGAMACELLASGFDIHGVDVSQSGVAIANRRAPGRFFLHDLYADQLPGPLQGRQFQTVIATEVIEHLYDPRGFLASVRGILAPAGELILSTPYHGYLKNLALAVTGKLDAHFTVLWDGGHIKFFSRRTLETMLREQGFTLVEFTGVGRLPWLWMSMLVKARLS